MALSIRFGLLSLLGTTLVLAVPIVVSSEATDLERHAAEELAIGLRWLYSQNEFVVQSDSAEGEAILIGVPPAVPPGSSPPLEPDSFVVTVNEVDGYRRGVIAGADPRGVLYAIYALLEELGYGFYLSYTAAPPRQVEEFAFQGWDLRDKPLFNERLVFNWHNFLSSASTWEFEDWKLYIDQAARMRFSGIMVHAYGNNPMFQFTHNGETKPVGYLSTTQSGRDWGTQHVNDVRALYGGAHVFDGPVFGSSAAMVPEEKRADAARELMQRVFAYAESRGMDINFAVDVDTLSANPQNVLRTLPSHALFTSSGAALANPDTPEGLAYYRSQIEKLIGDYPQIDTVTVWHRRNRTPWRAVKVVDFPAPWQAEFTRSAMAGDPDGPSMFAIGKIIKAFRRTLPKNIKLASGTWGFKHMAAADTYFPKDVTFMPLDYQIKFESEEVQGAIKAVSRRRRVVPIVWAHHDDFSYIGRPYTPFTRFASLLGSGGNEGYAIIHWTTRPLDLYFKSLSEQVWERTRDQEVETACRRMAERTFGERWAEVGAEFLSNFIHKAPMFGRETTDRFIDRPLGDGAPYFFHDQQLRMDRRTLSDQAFDHWTYFNSYTRFFGWFYRSHRALEKSIAALKDGKADLAWKELERARPEMTIEQYAIAARQGRISPGEKALIISLNLRWLPYFVAQRQVLGMEPVRVNFQPTQHDPLAQGAGRNTFFFDSRGRVWRGLGEKETGVKVSSDMERSVSSDFDPGLCASGLKIAEPQRLEMTALTGAQLLPGDYKVELLFRDRQVTKMVSATDGRVVVDVAPEDGRNLCALVMSR